MNRFSVRKVSEQWVVWDSRQLFALAGFDTLSAATACRDACEMIHTGHRARSDTGAEEARAPVKARVVLESAPGKVGIAQNGFGPGGDTRSEGLPTPQRE